MSISTLPDPVPPLIDFQDELQNVQYLNISSCNVILAEDWYKPRPFEASDRLIRTNERAIRLGGSNDMITLFEGTSQEKEDYLIGLVANSVFVAAFFLLWSCLILIFGYTGSYRNYGFLCGRFVRTARPEAKGSELADISLQADNNKDTEHEGDAEETNDSSEEKVLEKEERASAVSIVQDDEPELQDRNLDTNDRSLFAFLSEWWIGGKDQEEPKVTTLDEHAIRNGNHKTTAPEDADQVLSEPNDGGGEGGDVAPSDKSSLVPEHETQNPTAEKQQVLPISEIRAADDHDGEKVLQQWKRAHQHQERRLFRTRMAVALACLLVIVAASLFCGYGVKYIHATFQTTKTGITHIQLLCQGAIKVIDQFIDLQNQAAHQTKIALGKLDGICPLVGNKVCQRGLEDEAACRFRDVPFVNQTLQAVVDRTSNARSFILEEVHAMRDDLYDIVKSLDKFLSGQDHMEWVFWISFAFTLLLGTVCGLFIWGIFYLEFMSNKRILDQEPEQIVHQINMVRRHILMPVFISLTLLAYCFAVAFVILAIGASDWCINSPDTKTTAVLENNEKKLDSIIYAYSKYYVNQCDSNLLPITLFRHSETLFDLLRTLDNFSRNVQQVDPVQWRETCGSSVTVLETFGDVMNSTFCVLSLTLEDINRFLWCRQFSPVYQLFMHTAICYDAQSGLTWVAGSMFAIVLNAFVVLLLRAAAYDIQTEEEYQQVMAKHRARWGFCLTGCGVSNVGRRVYQSARHDTREDGKTAFSLSASPAESFKPTTSTML